MGKLSGSSFAAALQAIISRRREESGLYQEIALQLPLDQVERVLDVGTGTGLQLKVIHQLNPQVKLFGLDISPAAIRTASRALKGIQADLRIGSIASTTYPANFFDIVTCSSSMSYWDTPLDCFNEIFRILRPGGQAVFFEPHRDINIEAALDQIRRNLEGKSPLRRWGAVQLNKFGLKRGARLGMRLYSISELQELAAASRFGSNSEIAETSLLKVPIFVRIHLCKPGRLEASTE